MSTSRSVEGQFRYLPQEPEDEVWGIFLLDAGTATIPRDSDYPPAGHPEGYHFQWTEGRVLTEFQIILIRAGHGVLETRRGGRCSVRAGQAFVLFPGEWHRYRPAAGEGWSESWIGFSGDYAAHLMRSFFSPSDPVISLNEPQKVNEAITLLVNATTSWPKASSRSRLSLRVLEVIADLHHSRIALSLNTVGPGLESARLDILTRAAERIQWRDMARRHHMSYATFRRRFKAMTGRSPIDYQIQVRLNRAAELLRHTPLAVREVAERLGYTHVHFFSRQFKQRFGKSPQNFRARNSSEGSSK